MVGSSCYIHRYFRIDNRSFRSIKVENQSRFNDIDSRCEITIGRHLEIESWFDAIVCHDDVARPQPPPDMLEAILRALKIPRDAALFVGDGPRDEAAAQAAGVEYVMVDWGFTEHADDQEVVRSATELRERIEKGYFVMEKQPGASTPGRHAMRD